MDTVVNTNLSVLLLGLICVHWIKCQTQPKELSEVCDSKTFRPSCDDGHVILMTHAQYGRMRLGTCVVQEYGHLGCAKDVLDITDRWCSGVPTCEIPVPSPELSDTQPCPPDLRPYLEVTYSCVKVDSPQRVCPPDKPIPLKRSPGYLTNGIQSNLNCGTATTPYRITTKPGQEIVLTVYDFKISAKSHHHNRFNPCDPVAEVIEGQDEGQKSSREICAGLGRETESVRTKSNQVDIVLIDRGREDQQMEYMIHYQVLGCPNLPPIPAATVTKSGDDVTIKCNHTSDVYQLTCTNNEWTGSLKNCSRVDPQNGPLDESDIPYGISIFIVIIIALVIGLVVLIFGLLFLRRRNHLCGPRFPRPTTEHTDKDYTSYYQTSTYCRKPPGTDLPPCTPLMVPEQIYAHQQTNSERLACGCPIYMSRDEVQNQQNECCRPGNGTGNSTTTDFLSALSHPDRLTIGPDMVPIHERQIFLTNTLPNSPKRLSHHSTFKPGNLDVNEVEINGIKAKSKDNTTKQDTAVVLAGSGGGSGENRTLSQNNGEDRTSRILVAHSSDASDPSDSEASAFMPRH